MRICFLFNHDQVHQVAHSLPIALALARRRTGAEVIIGSANDRITKEIRAIAGDSIGAELRLVELKLDRWSSRVVDAIAGHIIPSSKLLMYSDNLEFFRSLDVLVVPEKTSLVLKDHFHLDKLKIIHTRHGAGDRAIGFNRASARFDHVLAAGPKIRDRLVRDAGVPPDKITIVGYPKFDLFAPSGINPRPVSPRPTVVYNPHVAPHLSSWYKSGSQILGWFARHAEYQLIFAPHIMLFERKLVVTIQPPRIARPGRISRAVREADNIKIDTHGRALTTMEYLNQADIYLGDASSQVYEFMVEPRPCIFFNSHSSDWEGNPNFAHWNAGRVLANLSELEDALANASAEHELRYRSVQEEMLRSTFDLNGTPSSVRAAQVIFEIAATQPARKRARSRTNRIGQPVPALAGAGPEACL